MIGININMPESCKECMFMKTHDGTCLFFETKNTPDTGKAEWCPLLRSEIVKRQAVYSETELQFFGEEMIIDKFSKNSATAIGNFMLDNGAIFVFDETRDYFPDDYNTTPDFRQNKILTALAFIVIPRAVNVYGEIVNEDSRKS